MGQNVLNSSDFSNRGKGCTDGRMKVRNEDVTLLQINRKIPSIFHTIYVIVPTNEK